MCTKFGESGSNWVNMSEVLVAEQVTSNLNEVPQYESSYKEGDTGELRLYLSQDLTQIQIDDLEKDIVSKGVILTKPITQDARVLIISFQKAIAPLLIIAGSVGIIAIGILGWQIWKSTSYGVPVWVWGLIIGGIIIYAISGESSRQARSYGKRYLAKGLIRS